VGSRVDSPPESRLLREMTYFEYQRRVCRDVILPWLAVRLVLRGLRVGDFGAHQGGMLDALRESGLVDRALGFEVGEEIVASSPFVSDGRFRLECRDILDVAPEGALFDLVLMHDVLEHVPNYGDALDAVRRTLGESGHAFVSFPPYHSAFGGHQQLARGMARSIPFVHLLPARLFFRLAQPGETEYMSASDAWEDMTSVRRTRLSLSRAERAFARCGLRVVDRDLFVVRPEYTVRYGLRARRAKGVGRLAGVREVLVNGAFYLLRPE
jgi:hypothetical protein